MSLSLQKAPEDRGDGAASPTAMILDVSQLFPHVPSLAVRLSTTTRNGLAELQSGRIALGIAPVPGTLPSRRPVLRCYQVDRVRIQVILPDAGLGELERVVIVRRDGTFNDDRFRLKRPIVTRGRLRVAVGRGRCGDVLPDIG